MLSNHICLTLDNAQADFILFCLKSFFQNFKPENTYASLFRESARQVYEKYAGKYYLESTYSDKGLRMRLTPLESYGLMAVIETALDHPELTHDAWKFQVLRTLFEKLNNETKEKFHSKPLIVYGN